MSCCLFFFCKQKTAYEMRMSDWSSDVCSSDLCEQGHPLFGPACGLIRAEALVRLDSDSPLPKGLLALGQRGAQGFETRHGSELLMFLGRVLTRCMGR